jgi:hypothetical protein
MRVVLLLAVAGLTSSAAAEDFAKTDPPDEVARPTFSIGGFWSAAGKFTDKFDTTVFGLTVGVPVTEADWLFASYGLGDVTYDGGSLYGADQDGSSMHEGQLGYARALCFRGDQLCAMPGASLGLQRGDLQYAQGPEFDDLPFATRFTRAFGAIRGTGRVLVGSRLALHASVGARYTVSWLDGSYMGWFAGDVEHALGAEVRIGADFVW